MKIIYPCALGALFFCGACDPVTLAFGGTAALGTTSVRNQKGISGSISDTELQTKINHALFSQDKDLFDRIELAVKHGMVVVIGYMDDDSKRERAIQIVKSVKGYEEIFNEIKVQESPNASDFAKDSTITSRVKSSLLFDGNVSSLNYDVTTVKGIVYICGTAQSSYERDVVLNHARTTSGVEKVVAYIRLNKDRKN
ncbi:MAG: BON domain-containing protein [Holosporaceae bacterium]|jgi:osmotically-inducible protein OsmY|nr:BON domain-containing protein [Holosporaceae bacterium]